MKVCKNCGEINQPDAEFCCKCGQNVFSDARQVICPLCGAANDAEYDHCINCGGKLKSVQQRTVKNEIERIYGEKQAAEVVAKESARCPNCGAELALNEVFCTKCGTPVAKLHEHRVVRRKICPGCGMPNPNDFKYCEYCFTSLNEAESDEFQLIHESKPLGKTVVLQAYLQNSEGKYRICGNCGALNKPDSDFCVNCGLKLIVEPQVRYCANCGAENDADAQFCNNCRWSFDGVTPDSVEGVWSCRKCHTVNDKNSNFCVHCGAKK